MEDKKKLKLMKFKEILNQDVLLIGESIDWSVLGTKIKRESLKKRGIEYTLMRKSYMSYFYTDLKLFKGNVILISLKKNLTYIGFKQVIENLEKEIGVLPLFLIINKRIISLNYFIELLKDGVRKESINEVLSNTLKKEINKISIINKNIIKVLSKIKENANN